AATPESPAPTTSTSTCSAAIGSRPLAYTSASRLAHDRSARHAGAAQLTVSHFLFRIAAAVGAVKGARRSGAGVRLPSAPVVAQLTGWGSRHPLYWHRRVDVCPRTAHGPPRADGRPPRDPRPSCRAIILKEPAMTRHLPRLARAYAALAVLAAALAACAIG